MKTNFFPSKPAGALRALLLCSALISLASAPPPASAATPSELLEQGIYSEETKGDLDAAMQLYQRVVSETKTGQSLAAQAQYRLGVCLYKKRLFAQANAAFEKLLSDYPEEKSLVAQASEYLAGAALLLRVPWLDGEELRLDLKTATGFKLGYIRYTAQADTRDGHPIWRLRSFLSAGAQQASRVDVDATTFKPIQSRWKHTVLGDAETSYRPGRAEVKLAGSSELKTADLPGVCYDNEEVVHLVRRLPLAPGYSTTLQVFTSLGGARTLPIKLEVTSVETLEVPAGSFECFQIKLGLVNQTFWYSTDAHRYLVKFAAGAITAELSAVEQRTASSAMTDDVFEFPLGEAGGGVPAVSAPTSQPPQNQAKLLILAAAALPALPAANQWCDTLNASASRLPAVPTNTTFALNSRVAGRALNSLPADTVVFFETPPPGWNQSGTAERLAQKTSGVAVAFADGRALLVDPSDVTSLRWTP